MAQAHGAALTFLIFLWILSLTQSKEANVTCIFHEDCVLPCSFRPPGTVVIHWYKQQIPVHSYYYNKDQFGLQNKHFSGRTCLFNSQISTNGNASLLLRRVKVQDKGRYKCYTSTRKGNHETFVNLEVKALIQSVHIEVTDRTVTCSSHNIYPVPQVAWATDPPAALGALQNITTVKTPDARGLFTVKSTLLRMPGNSSDHAYFCSFISADKAQVWTASRRNQEDMTEEEGHAFSIPCIAPRNLQNFSLTWTFTGPGEPAAVTVIRYDSRSRLTFNLWEGRAALDQDAVLMGNGSLLLLHPESQEHAGTYTCTFSGLQSRHMVRTKVNVTLTPISVEDERVERSWWSTAASATFFMFTIFVVLSQCLRLRAPGTRGLSHRHNGTGLNDGGHDEHLNPTVSFVTRPYAVKDALPQPEPHLQLEQEGDIPQIEGNYSAGPQPNSTYMEQAKESAGPPMAGNCGLHTDSEESGEVTPHMPGLCAQDLDVMRLVSTLEGDMVEQQTEDDGTRTELLPQQDAPTAQT